MRVSRRTVYSSRCFSKNCLESASSSPVAQASSAKARREGAQYVEGGSGKEKDDERRGPFTQKMILVEA